MRTRMMAVSVLLLAMVGCGDSVEHRLLRGETDLKANKAESALKAADSVLTEQPGNEKAMLLKARAQLQLMELEGARATIDSLLLEQGKVPDVRRTALSWGFRQMSKTLQQSEFISNPQLQSRFDEALAFAREQVEALNQLGEKPADAQFTSAQLAFSDARRWEVLLNYNLKNSRYREPDGSLTPEGQRVVDNLQKQFDERQAQTLESLKKVFEVDSKHYRAARMYIEILAANRAWDDLWNVATQLSQQKDLPDTLSGALIMAILRTPNNIKTPQQRMELGWKLQEAVIPRARNGGTWKITSARLHILMEEWDKAQPLLEQILAVEPRNVDGRYLLAQVFYAKKDFPRAKALLTKLAQEHRNSPQVQSLYGRVLMETKDEALAAEALAQAIKLNPNDMTARTAQLILMASQHQLDTAQEQVNTAYIQSPADPRTIRIKIQFDQMQGNNNEVLAVLRKVEGLSPITPDHLMILIDGYRYLNKWDSMEKYARELVAREPADPLPAQVAIAEALLGQKKDNEVKQLLVELRQKFPQAASVDVVLGRLYVQRQSFDRAVEVLEVAVENDPDNREARLLLARALAGLSLPDEALLNIEHVLQRQPDDVAAHALAARIYQFVGQPERADEHLSKIDETKIDERTGPGLLAQLKIRKGKLDEAAQICNAAIASGNTDPVLRLLLALIYRHQNKPLEAETHLLSLVKSQPNNPQIYALLTRFYREQRQVDRGMIELERLQAVNEPMARLAQAALLNSSGRPDDAIARLLRIYETLIARRGNLSPTINDPKLALTVADALSSIHRNKNDRAAAVAVYDQLIQANLFTSEATLRQIDITSTAEDKEATVKRLDALASKVSPDERALRYQIMRRFASLERPDRALAILDEWIARQADQVVLLRWKAELLMELQRFDEAVAVCAQAIQVAPENTPVRMRLARAHLAKRDFPAAEKTLLDMAQIDAAARVEAMAALGELFLSLGLHEQAANTFKELEKAARPKDPRVIYAMGRALAALKQDNEAIQRLQDIPPYAPQYAAAQLLLARIEQRKGMIEQAKQRLGAMSRDARTAVPAARELLALNLINSQDEDLARWVDIALAFESLPDQVKRQWLRVRIFVHSNKQDWVATLDSMNFLGELEPGQPKVTAARIMLMAYLNKTEQARQLFRATPGLPSSNIGPLIAMVVEDAPDMSAKMSPFPQYLLALASGDINGARSAAQNLPAFKTLYRKDLLALLDRGDARSPETAAAARQMAAAVVALEAGLPQLCVQICKDVIKKSPAMAPAYGLMIQGQLDLNQSTDSTLKLAAQSLPASSLTLFLNARQKSQQNDDAGAVEQLRKLYERETDNAHVHYQFAAAMHKAKQYDAVIPHYQAIWNSEGPYKVIAGNDLAYLLALHQPQRIEEAAKIAQAALEGDKNNASILDTVGWIEHLRNDNASALNRLSQAVLTLNNLPEVHLHLGVVYGSLGNKTWARYHLSEAARSGGGGPEAAQAQAEMSKLGS